MLALTPVEIPKSERRLVAWWKLDESEGSQAADSSVNNLVGTLIGDPQWQPTAGKLGGALQFDGDGDYVDCGYDPALDFVHAISITTWIKVDAFDKEYQAVVAKGNYGWRLLRNKQGNALVFACNPSSMLGVYGKTGVNDGTWHHVAATYDGTRIALYVDGEVDRAKPDTGSIWVDDQPVYIGENPQHRGSEWNGLIDDVRIYNYALSQDDIAAISSGKEPATTAQAEIPAAVEEEPRTSKNWILVLIIVVIAAVAIGLTTRKKKSTT